MTSQSGPDVGDAAVAEELRAHHAIMIGELDRLTASLADAASAGRDAAGAKRELVRWITDVLVPHAAEEEATTYAACSELAEGRLLIQSMLSEHVLIRKIATGLSDANDPLVAATYGRVLFDMFDSHQRKENEIILPLLVASDEISLAAVVGDAHGHGHLDEHAHEHRHDLDGGHEIRTEDGE